MRSPSTGTELEVDSLGDRWQAAWAGRDAAAFTDCCTPDVHYEDPVLAAPVGGLDPLVRHAQALWRAFPDLRVERTATRVAQGRFACLPWRALGTQRGELADIPPSGRFVILHGIHYVEVLDGQIRRARGFFDLYDAAVQLGFMPTRGSLGERALLALRGFGLRSRS